jgi:branched-chain amino acid transport system substrate-binding protein
MNVYDSSMRLEANRRSRLFYFSLTLGISVYTLPLDQKTFAVEEIVSIAYQGPLTGEEAVIGIDQLNGVKYAVNLFNEKYAGKVKVVIKNIDDQGSAAVASRVAEIAARDNSILGIVGAAYSGASIASFPYYKTANIPMISPSASRVSITDPQQGLVGFPIFHRLAFTDKGQGPSLYSIAISGVNNPKVFVIDDQSAYGVGLIDYMKRGTPTPTFVGSDSVSDRTTDWTPSISKVKTSGANVVIFAGYYPQTATLVRQLRDSGFAGVIASGDGSMSPGITGLAPLSVLDGVRLTSSTVPLGYISPSLEIDFKNKIGVASGTFALESLDAANIFLYCIATGVRTRSAMLTCVKNFKGTSLSGQTIAFDANGDRVNPKWYEFWISKNSVGTLPYLLMSNTWGSVLTLDAAWKTFPWYSITAPSPTPSATQTSVTTTCSGRNAVSTAGLFRLTNNTIQVDAQVNACSYEIVVVSDSGETFRTGIINSTSNSLTTVKEEFINATCLTGYSFYLNAWSERNGGGTLNKTAMNRMLSASCSASSSTTTKPSTPTFSAVTFSGNKININVNLGSSSNRPEKVYLVAPKLGFTSANPNQGTISGNSATWSLDLNSLLGGTAIPLEIVGEKDGVKSDSLIGTYQVPGSTKATSIPSAPTKYTSRIVGTSVLITVQVGTNAKNAPSEALLFSKSLGIAWPKTISGDIAGSKAIFEIPLKNSMAGKKYPLTIYLTNSIGESKPLNATLSIPAAPKKPTIPTALPQPKVPETVICVRANQTRTFTGTSCPTGWTKR